MKRNLFVVLAALLILSCKKNDIAMGSFNPIILNKILVSTGSAELAKSNSTPLSSPVNPYLNTLYTIDNNGGNKTIIQLPDTLMAEYASWSVDGSKIVFDSPSLRSYELYTINIDGSNCKQITFKPLPAEEMCPSFSPDGKNILYLGVNNFVFGTNSAQIHLINTDGSNDKQLVNITDPISNSAGVSSASYSPNATKIVFVNTISQQIFTLNTDATNIMPLTLSPDSYAKYNPSFSADGKFILYTNGYQIFKCNTDGSNIQQLTSFVQNVNTNETLVGDVSWSPDASKIVYLADIVTQNSNSTDVYTMNANGTGITRLTFDGGKKNWARWR